MSKALRYLMELKPEAMEHYFSFIRKSGSQLDEKTRAVISIITKVDNQTDRGVRQYVKRGLALGLTPAEIIDALFVAFPTLGLSKIVWAVDILLDMDIPGFEVENIRGEPAWHRLAPLDEIAEGLSFLEDCDGRDLMLFRAGDTLSVYDRACPHQSTRFPQADRGQKEIRCPAHGWLFKLSTGECIERGDRPLKRFSTRIEDDVLYACW